MTGASRLGTSVNETVAPVLASTLPVHYREVQRDRRPTGSLGLHERNGIRRGLKYPRRTLVEETPGPWKEGQDWKSVRKRVD